MSKMNLDMAHLRYQKESLAMPFLKEGLKPPEPEQVALASPLTRTLIASEQFFIRVDCSSQTRLQRIH